MTTVEITDRTDMMTKLEQLLVLDPRLRFNSDGRPWGASPSNDRLQRHVRARPDFPGHVLRHSHGSTLAMRGVPMGVIAAQLGHADTRMTEKHYAHLAPNYVAQTIRANFPVLGLTDGADVIPLHRAKA